MSLHGSGSSTLGVDADEGLSLEDTVGVDVDEEFSLDVSSDDAGGHVDEGLSLDVSPDSEFNSESIKDDTIVVSIRGYSEFIIQDKIIITLTWFRLLEE